jgi:signal transduction histidine kinase
MPAQPGHLCFSISDEGPGISSDLMNRVFDPFFTTRKGGTGLGLSIVKHIVENHNGTISLINNTPAPGVTVKICLPLTIDSNVSSDLRLN